MIRSPCVNNEVKDSRRHASSSLNSSAIIGAGDSEAMCVMSAIFLPLDIAIGRGLHPDFGMWVIAMELYLESAVCIMCSMCPPPLSDGLN